MGISRSKVIHFFSFLLVLLYFIVFCCMSWLRCLLNVCFGCLFYFCACFCLHLVEMEKSTGHSRPQAIGRRPTPTLSTATINAQPPRRQPPHRQPPAANNLQAATSNSKHVAPTQSLRSRWSASLYGQTHTFKPLYSNREPVQQKQKQF